MEHPFRGMATPLPRAGAPFLKSMEPLSPKDRDPFTEGWKPPSRGMGTALSLDGSGRVLTFSTRAKSHMLSLVPCVNEVVGGRTPPRPLRFKSLHEQGGRIPTCRQRLNSRSHDLTFSHCSSCSVRLIPHFTPYVFRDPSSGLTRHIAPAGEK